MIQVPLNCTLVQLTVFWETPSEPLLRTTTLPAYPPNQALVNRVAPDGLAVEGTPDVLRKSVVVPPAGNDPVTVP